jgi:protein O-mannosyl-transferase
VSLGFHIANTLLLLWFLHYTTGRFWPAALVAALFALHPLHVESVAWIAERKDVLSTFFWLGTTLAYAWYVKRPRAMSYVLVMLLFGLGLLAKPMLVTLPVVLLLLDYWPLERFSIDSGGWHGVGPGRLLLEKLPLALMAGGSATITLIAQQSAMPAWELMDMPMRITNAVISYWRYVLAMLWPAGLAPFYPHPHKAFWGLATMGFFLMAAATWAAAYFGARRKYLTAGWLWYVITLVPVIGLVQVGDQSHADRYTYVPLIGLFVIVAWSVADLCQRRSDLLKPVIATTTIVLAVLGVVACRQVGFWKDNITLFSRTVRVTQDNYVMLTNLGVAYSTKDELDRAVDSFQQSLAIRPNEAYTHNGLGVVYLKNREYEKAVDEFKQAVELKPELKEAQMHAAKSLMALGRYQEAEYYARKTTELDPRWADGHVQLAAALSEIGQVDKAEEECRKAMQLNPKLAMAHFTMAGVYVKRGDFEHAAEEYRKSIAIEPDFSAWNNLGNAQLRMGRLQEAEQSYRESIRLNPNRADAFLNMGIALSGLGRKDEAIAAVRQAQILSPKSQDIQRFLESLQKQP